MASALATDEILPRIRDRMGPGTVFSREVLLPSDMNIMSISGTDVFRPRLTGNNVPDWFHLVSSFGEPGYSGMSTVFDGQEAP